MKTPVRKLALGLASVLAMGAAAVPAQAAPTLADQNRAMTAQEGADMQCMAVFSVLAAQTGRAEAAAVGVFYFLGQLEGQDRSIDWLERFHDYARTADEADLNAHVQRCTQQVADRGKKMQEVGGRLTGAPQS